MSGFIKRMCMVLVLVVLCFGGSLAATKTIKCVSMNNQACSVRPMLIDLNLDELYYYPTIVNE